MMLDENTVGPSNPFSTRYVRPGAMAYQFAAGDSAAAMIDRLAACGGWAQIVGPHGAGKSTLVATLVKSLRQSGRATCVFSLVDRQRRMPADWVEQARGARPDTVVVDGYEQLSRWNRWRLKARCRRAGWGLLVTAHQSVGFATLARVVPSLAVARAVVGLLVRGDRVSVTDSDVAECFRAAGGNLRETLFALYDRYERQRRGALVASQAEAR